MDRPQEGQPSDRPAGDAVAKTTDGVHIAYQVVGDGTVDLVFVMDWTTNLETRTVNDLVTGSGLTFVGAGEHELKGAPDRWRLYRVVGG